MMNKALFLWTDAGRKFCGQKTLLPAGLGRNMIGKGIIDMKPDTRDLSLYVHIPFCRHKCIYCDFLSFGASGYDERRQYISALCREIEAYQAVAENYLVQTIFIGGGTPSYIVADWIAEVMQTIYQVFHVDVNAEITLEGNPDSLKADKLQIYRQTGINRLSIGLQSADDNMLKNLGRIHDYDQFIEAYYDARKAGFDNINIDIMSGLPGETKESYIRTLKRVLDLRPEHISAYSLIVEEGTLLSENDRLLALLPSEEEERELYAVTKKLLKDSGYNRYEISNYAKKGFTCRHNIVYWTGGEYLGVGLGASSYLAIWLEDGKCEKIRFHGVENLEEYIGRFLKCDGVREDEYTNLYHFYEEEAEERLFGDAGADLKQYRDYEKNAFLEFLRDYYNDLYFLKRKDEIEEFMFLGLRLMKGISKTEFKERFGAEIESIYGKVMEKYKKSQLLIEQDDRLFLSDKGIDVSNVVMAEFIL